MHTAQQAYPGLTNLGDWTDYLTDDPWPVYTTGSPATGWLDMYFDPTTGTLNFVQARTDAVPWGQPSFGC